MHVLTIDQFLASEAGTHAKAELQRLTENASYHTTMSYDIVVGRQTTFIERHLNYLAAHPYVKPEAYLTNLKVMIRFR